jgi:hypothetical protein
MLNSTLRQTKGITRKGMALQLGPTADGTECSGCQEVSSDVYTAIRVQGRRRGCMSLCELVSRLNRSLG